MNRREIILVIFILNYLVIALGFIGACLSIALGLWHIIDMDITFKTLISSLLLLMLGFIWSSSLTRTYLKNGLDL